MPKASKGKKGGDSKKRTQQSQRAGLIMPVSRFKRLMRKSRVTDRVGKTAPIFMAAVAEYLVAEIVELAGNAAKDNKRKRIKPRDVMMAIRGDEELNKICDRVIFPWGGVLPNIHSVLVPIKKKKNKKSTKKKKKRDEE